MHNFGLSDLFEGSINERFMCMQPYLAHYRAPAKCNIGKSDRETDAAETLKLRNLQTQYHFFYTLYNYKF
jgi:hypothetical protein